MQSACRVGIPPGWRIVDAEWTIIVDAAEQRVVELHDLEGVDRAVWACYQRWGRGPDLEFYLIGWTVDDGDAEAWLRGEVPSVIAALNVLPGHVAGVTDAPQYGHPQA